MQQVLLVTEVTMFGGVGKLVGCLLSMHEALASLSSTIWTGSGATRQHSEGKGRRTNVQGHPWVHSLRPGWITWDPVSTDIAITIIMTLFPINWGKGREEMDTHIYLMSLPWQNFMLLILFITKTPQWRPGETISSAFHRDMWYRDSQKSWVMLSLRRGSRDLSLSWTSFFPCVPSTKYPWICHSSGGGQKSKLKMSRWPGSLQGCSVTGRGASLHILASGGVWCSYLGLWQCNSEPSLFLHKAFPLHLQIHFCFPKDIH